MTAFILSAEIIQEVTSFASQSHFLRTVSVMAKIFCKRFCLKYRNIQMILHSNIFWLFPSAAYIGSVGEVDSFLDGKGAEIKESKARRCSC